MSIYKKMAKADQKNVEGGYKNVVLFAPVADATSWAKPTDTPAALGDRVTITDNHVFSAGNGFISLVTKKHSVTSTAETTGEDGAKSLTWKAKFTILGDSASTLESMQEMLNDDLIFLLKDQDCLNATDRVQFGDECTSPDINITFDGKTTKEGLKEYTLELSVKAKKFFYLGDVTEKPEDGAMPSTPLITSQPVSQDLSIGDTLALAVGATISVSATYQWRKNGIAISGATRKYYVKDSVDANDAGTYTVVVTDAVGTATSNGAIVTVS
jgi:hypothetical protein